jgi:hypothetical protein
MAHVAPTISTRRDARQRTGKLEAKSLRQTEYSITGQK